MNRLLQASRVIDAINDKFGAVATWLVLIACLISAGNAISRYLFNASSNAWLEVQWYMFAAMVLLGGPYTLKVNEHVRVDLFYSAVSERTRIWIDIIGGFLFLLPICMILIYFTWPWFLDSWRIDETLVECRRAHPLAGQAHPAARLLADGAARHLRDHQAHRGARPSSPARSTVRKAAAMIDFVRENMAPLMFGGIVVFMLIGYPAAFSLAAVGLFFGFIGIELGLIEPDFLGNLTYQLFGIVSNDTAARHPVLHLHGCDPGALRPGRGPARFHRPIFRPGARRTVLCGDLRRRHSRRHHRHGRGFGHRHGRDLAAGDDADTAIRRGIRSA